MPVVTIDFAITPEDLRHIRELFEEYAASLPVDLAFQRFDEELATLPGGYSAPSACLLLARSDTVPVGCVGIRPLEPGIAELKRLFVREAGRARGTGQALIHAALAFAERAGYQRIRLDTLPYMTAALTLYDRIGFRVIPAYRHNPVPGTVFLELVLPPDSGVRRARDDHDRL
jgi:GNAT superfamily N-acetyltransferase